MPLFRGKHFRVLYCEKNSARRLFSRFVSGSQRRGDDKQKTYRICQTNTAILFCVFTPAKKPKSHEDENITYLSLKRSPVAFPMDEDLKYDPLFQRHSNRVLRELIEFQARCFAYYGLKRCEHHRRVSRVETAIAARRLVAHESARIRGAATDAECSVFCPKFDRSN